MRVVLGLSLLVGRVFASKCPCQQANAVILKYKAYDESNECLGNLHSTWTSVFNNTGSKTSRENTTLEATLTCEDFADKFKDHKYECTCSSIYAIWDDRIDSLEFTDGSIFSDFQTAGMKLQDGCVSLEARQTNIRSIHFTCENADLTELATMNGALSATKIHYVCNLNRDACFVL